MDFKEDCQIEYVLIYGAYLRAGYMNKILCLGGVWVL